MRRGKIVLASISTLAALALLSSGLPVGATESDSKPIPTVDPQGNPYDHELTVTLLAANSVYTEFHEEVGFAGVEAASQYDVILYWVGDIDPETVARAEEVAAPTPLRVDRGSRPYTLELLESQVARITEDATLRAQGLWGAGFLPDFSELVLLVEPDSTLGGPRDSTLDYLEVPYTITKEEAPDETAGRQVDEGSLDGGANIAIAKDNGSFGACTTGVPATSRSRGTRGMLIAWHCKGGAGNDTLVMLGTSPSYRGTFRHWSAGLDVAFFDGYSSGYASWIYNGHYAAPQSSRDGVGFALNPVVYADWARSYCLRGARSGELCNQRINLVGTSITIEALRL